MQTKYNIGDMVYVSDVKESKIYMGTIHEIFIGDDVITYKVSYACYKEKYCHPTFEEARAYRKMFGKYLRESQWDNLVAHVYL